MENIGIWIMVIVAWVLFIASYLIPGIDWTLIILVLSIIAFSLIADWLISDTKTKKKRQDQSPAQASPSSSG